MSVDVGYDGQYRASAWTPVRVTVHNRTGSLIDATVRVDDSSTNQQGPPRTFRTAYEAPVILPAGATKLVTLYMPGSDVQYSVDVSVAAGGRTLASASADVSDFGTSAVSAGVLVDDPANDRWLNQIQTYSISPVRLTPATLDPYPQALASFDAIVLADVDSSRLGRDQIAALTQYVRNGGSLILVGGPGWQQTLQPLPAGLVPGRLAGTTTLPDLRGLLSIQKAGTLWVPPKRWQAATVSVLSRPRGSVLASEAGVPLVVRAPLGKGQITYLAFDPALAPFPHWSTDGDLLARILTIAAPMAADRTTLPAGYPSIPPFFSPWGPADISQELANVPAAALPSLILFIALAAVYILLLGPANFLVLRRFGRREWAWITIPALALVCVGSTFFIAYRLKGNTVLVNSVGIVQLDGSDQQRPTTLYLGLFAPLRGDYQLTYNSAAFASGVQTNYYYGGPPGPGSSLPLTLRFQQGTRTGVSFLSMNMWSMRDVRLQTTTDVPGSITSNLTVDAHGNVVGTVHNGTHLDLLRPAILAGRGVAHLRDISAGATVQVRVHPSTDLFDQSPVWMNLYGTPNYQGGGVFYGGPLISVVGSRKFIAMGGCCPGPSLPPENNLADRIRNVAAMLPEGWTLPSAAEVMLVGWSEQPLGSFSVDGSPPQRRDLDLITAPLSVHLVRGPFLLRRGTLGAHLVDILPVQSSSCCPGPPGVQPITLGVGGWATFEFDIPHHGSLHFRRLTLSVNAGGPDGTNIGHVYDWRARAWVPINLETGDADLRDPDRFVSPAGAVLLRLKATGYTPDGSFGPTDINIQDVHQDLQISGSGVLT
ncbi:MAG: hypothetical protein JOZ41_14610 [Chloroflexi bacterium]|nr:hypothetical protein [Chloroflexota bacterium]